MPFIDFASLKEAVDISAVVSFLDLKLENKGTSLRGKCPVCESDQTRNLVVTPSKGVFYCFSAQEGGDQIALTAHIQGVTVKDAAKELHNHFVQSGTPAEPKEKGMQPLSYLQSVHPSLDALEFNQEVAEAVGIGFAPKGMMKGNVAVPIRLPDGKLIGYIGIQEAILPPDWKL